MSAIIVAIEGIDGSGKATQTDLLCSKLKADIGEDQVVSFSYPRYNTGLFSGLIAQYLNGKLGHLEDLSPRLVATLFAGDRFESRENLRQEQSKRQIILVDRYVSSNIAHQGAKVPACDVPEFSIWIQELEYTVYGMPRPNITIFLDMPPDLSWELIEKKKPRNYTLESRDIHEANRDYLYKVHRMYRTLSEDISWIKIKCVENGKLRLPEEIFNDTLTSLQKIIKPM